MQAFISTTCRPYRTRCFQKNFPRSIQPKPSYLDRKIAITRPLVFISAIFCPTVASYIRYDQGVSQWTAEDPLVTIINTSNKYQAYSIETTAEAPSSAFAGCESCIKVPASKTIRFHPGRGFNGAMTANNHRSSRHEINFLADPTKC